VLQRTDGHEVAIAHGSHVGGAERHQRLSPARGEHELHLEAVRVVPVDDGAEIPAAQAVLRQVAVEDDGVEEVPHVHHPGTAVSEGTTVRTYGGPRCWSRNPGVARAVGQRMRPRSRAPRLRFGALLLATLTLLMGCHGKPAPPPVPAPLASAAPRVDPSETERRLSGLLGRLRKVHGITSLAAVDEFYLLSREFLVVARPTDFEALAADREPIVRAMGLLGLAEGPREPARRHLIAHLGDTAPIERFRCGCVGCIPDQFPLGAFARELLADAHYLVTCGHSSRAERPATAVPLPLVTDRELVGIDLEVLSRDEIAGLPFPSGRALADAIRAGELTLDLGGLTALGRWRGLEGWQIIKAVGRLLFEVGPQRDAQLRLLVGALHDHRLDSTARLAAASALTRFAEIEAFDALLLESDFLDAATSEPLADRFVEEFRTRRRHARLMRSVDAVVWDTPRDIVADRVLRVLEAQYPGALHDLLWSGVYGDRDGRIRAAWMQALVRLASRCVGAAEPWNSYAELRFEYRWELETNPFVLGFPTAAQREALGAALRGST
jgi:hypothetical protein